jgi:hypothetical protein
MGNKNYFHILSQQNPEIKTANGENKKINMMSLATSGVKYTKDHKNKRVNKKCKSLYYLKESCFITDLYINMNQIRPLS